MRKVYHQKHHQGTTVNMAQDFGAININLLEPTGQLGHVLWWQRCSTADIHTKGSPSNL